MFKSDHSCLAIWTQKVFVAIAIANSFATLARAFFFAYGGLCAASEVHKALLNKVIAAPVRFFDQNPSGRILNRLVMSSTGF